MANRIAGNVVIIDSAMGNSLVLASASTAVQIQNLYANTIAFWSIDTTGVMRLSLTDTTNCILQLTNPNNNPATVGAFIGKTRLNDLKIPTLTAGTAWVFLA